MPSQKFCALVETSIRLLTTPCPWCSDSSGLCSDCSAPHQECPTCESSGRCRECAGRGEIVPNPFSAGVVANVFSAWIAWMERARADQDFALFYEMWDILAAWNGRALCAALEDQHRSGVNIPEQIVRDVQLFGEVLSEQERPSATLTGGALSADELRELGIED